MSFSPPHIHSHEHRCPVLALGAACSGVDFQHTVHRVFLLAQHVFQLQVFNGCDGLAVVLVDFFLCNHLVVVEIEGQLQLVGQSAHILITINPFLDGLHFLHLFLCPLWVFPEIGSLRAQFLLFKFYLFSVDVQVAVQVFCTFQDIFQLVLSYHFTI